MADEERLIAASAEVIEGGTGARFELGTYPHAPSGFAIRYRGVAYGFVNRCPHMGTELDWQPGEFFDMSGLYLVCSTHGALFEPRTGRCIAGPCKGDSLERLVIRERAGQVFLATD